MGSIAGMVASIAVIGGAIALGRFVERRTQAMRRGAGAPDKPHGDPSYLDFERDPASGVFRAKASASSR